MSVFSVTASALLQRTVQRTVLGAKIPSGVSGSLSTLNSLRFSGNHACQLNTAARSISDSKILLALRSPALAGRYNFLRAAAGTAIPNKPIGCGWLFSASPFKRLMTNVAAGSSATATTTTTTTTATISGSTRRTVDAPIVGYWTLFCASMVFGIIVWGGLTRLTESGLSIVEWAPITGAKLPTSDEQWESEFEKYKQFPEYHKVHIGITLDDFKKIYFMEWFHRNIGRLFGIVYLVPAAYFVSKGMVTRSGIAKIGGLGLLLLGQGAMGWYMVASGLEKELGERPDAVPRVSQYRLTSHLSLAYLLYAGLSLYGWNVFRANRLARNKVANPEALRALMLKPNIVSFRRKITAATLLVGTTCLSGAMVAGLDAGLYYNEFPTMGQGLTPPLIDLWNTFYARGKPDTDMWRNLTENPVTVQLEHRILAMTTFFILSALWWQGRRLPLPRAARVMLHTMYGFAWLQVALGISTLVNFVPVAYASAHQANSVLLLASALGLYHTLRPLKLLPK
ncbi:Cytochrome c oxidase assembly protein cox15 [Coemansia erecta]|uniref:Cytochrome c oxidase assembly protein cox15 n=1 Tax=Coemansia asiatica TaxID=1052880 RepID=A0A9W7XLW9_9FUNG|nr:Cytochrome c oxidase assembly protein cox15 [Coemansia asiatica]KAJ2853673.1 Cytochrome c oxidase assembly protein cox15 [Coemansia erecta]KAJ2889101.1 Cytochrome c oxidase assembly protein cox15 [Coemansia asiatica]